MTRLLTPSEIELMELAQKAYPGSPWFDADALEEFYRETSDFIRGASPETITALLETLEKTREALRWALSLVSPMIVDRTLPMYDRVADRYDEVCALLSGFSGDAPSEEK